VSENSSDGNAPAPDGDAGGFDDDSMEVVLTKKQVDELFLRAKNSAAAEMRRAGEFRRDKQHDDPRVKRGLELLERYEGAQHQTQLRQAEADGRTAPFQEKVLDALNGVAERRGQRPASKYDQKVQRTIFDKLKTVRVSPTASRVPVNPNKGK
jgi:hypothetical protein